MLSKLFVTQLLIKSIAGTRVAQAELTILEADAVIEQHALHCQNIDGLCGVRRIAQPGS